MIEYAPITVSYAGELSSVSMSYRGVDSIPPCLSFCNCTVPGVSLCRSISNLTGRCVRCVY